MAAGRLYLTEGELTVLRALSETRAAGGWMVPSDIAAAIRTHVQIVRGDLSQLVRYGLIERGGWGAHGSRWGEWRITDRGRRELQARNQFELC